MSRRRSGRLAVVLAVSLASVALLASSLSASAASGTLKGSFGGRAYATFANATAGTIATQLGRSAFIPCPCKGTNGVLLSNTVDQVQADHVLKADATLSTARASKSAMKTAKVRMTAQVAGLRALDGAITADAILGVSRTSATAASLSTSTAGSTFVNLHILGHGIPSGVAANTQISLPGFGYVRLRETHRFGNGLTLRGVQVDMLHIVITRLNVLNIPIGTEIRVAEARSLYSRSQPTVVVHGAAWAASANSTSLTFENRVGKAAAIFMPCLGTKGKVKHNDVHLITVPGILTSGTGKTTVYGVVGDSATAKTTAEVQSLDMLGGLVTADLVRGVSRSHWSQSTDSSSVSSFGSRFVNLHVAGVAVGDNVAPNTELALPGIGTVTLYERIATSNADTADLNVAMIHVRVTMANALGLPVGTDLLVAVARSGVDRIVIGPL